MVDFYILLQTAPCEWWSSDYIMAKYTRSILTFSFAGNWFASLVPTSSRFLLSEFLLGRLMLVEGHPSFLFSGKSLLFCYSNKWSMIFCLTWQQNTDPLHSMATIQLMYACDTLQLKKIYWISNNQFLYVDEVVIKCTWLEVEVVCSKPTWVKSRQ